jgi:hypothetical protein
MKILLTFCVAFLSLSCIAANPTFANFRTTNSVFVSKSGSDTTGAKGNSATPFLTITAAKNASSAGDTIIVYPGTYTDNDLLKNGVNYYFYAGAVIYYQQQLATGQGWGIFDDRSSGATTNLIGGDGTFIYNAGTNGNTDDFMFLGNPDCRGGLVVTNANSIVKIEGDEFQATSYDAALANNTAALFVTNCRYVSAKFKRIYDPHGITPVTMVTDFEGVPVEFDAIPATTGIVWQVGEMHVECEELNESGHQYAIWLNEGIPNTGTSFYYTGNIVTGKTYMSGASSDWRSWFNVKWFNGKTTEGVYILGSGKHYITAEKISTDITAGQGAFINIATGATDGTNNVWLTAQKLSSPRTWISTGQGAITFANVSHFEDTGAVTNGIGIDGGIFHLDGGYAKVRNGNALLFRSGTAYIKNLTLDTSSANNAGNTPVLVTGNGLFLQNCVLVAPALADSIKGTSAFNVGLYGTTMANTAKNINITTIAGGTLTVNPLVQ